MADAAQLEHGHVLTQHQVLSSPSQNHAASLEYWKSTWCNWADVDAPAWTQIQNFFAAYVPKIGFKLEPIDLDQWKRAPRRFRPTAARGVDGISHVDLQMVHDGARCLDFAPFGSFEPDRPCSIRKAHSHPLWHSKLAGQGPRGYHHFTFQTGCDLFGYLPKLG